MMEILEIGRVIELEDSKEFIITDTIDSNSYRYLLLVNIEEEDEVMIRKYDYDLNLIVGLDSEDEVNVLLKEFLKKALI